MCVFVYIYQPEETREKSAPCNIAENIPGEDSKILKPKKERGYAVDRRQKIVVMQSI